MPLLLSIASEADMDELTKTQFAAFYPHEVFHDILWPGPPTSENLAKSKNRQLAWMAADGHSTYLKVTDTGTGEIVAGAKWCVYDKDPNRSAVLTVDWYGDEGSEDRAYAQYLIDEFNGRRTERMKGSYCLLDICFCNPTHHRRGAGAQLVKWGCDRADEMGVQAFVEATLTGRRLYEKHGFVVTEAVDLKAERWPDRPLIQYLFMHRPARGKGNGKVTEDDTNGVNDLKSVERVNEANGVADVDVLVNGNGTNGVYDADGHA
ncbi:MAG: hypothetical protein FRX48_03753 [Lasallia pustulata]|uniref:GNAT domain n=1 Tax=Lasallia pustulata TaxID=136370 RepID=A0A1W5CY78_9LECA|nr:MAG: hypothetical protein FRX48_03753 [Lasallia pustulata]SLM35833.1 GNAT domain [Lasallia pustulata]